MSDDPRDAFHEALAIELERDIDDEFKAAADRVLMQLWRLGFVIDALREDLNDGEPES